MKLKAKAKIERKALIKSESSEEPNKIKEESFFSIGQSWTRGQLVEAKFRGRGSRYYRGTIKNISGNKCDIDYEDGDRDRNLSLEHVRKLDAGSNEQQRRRDRRIGNAAARISVDGEINAAVASAITDEKVVDSVSDEQQFKKGDRVMARFRGRSKRFYRGVIAECHEKNLFTIHYDDGDRDKELSAEFIRAIDSADLAVKDISGNHLEVALKSEKEEVEDDKKKAVKVQEKIPVDSTAGRDFTKVKLAGSTELVATASRENVNVELAPDDVNAIVPVPDAADGDVSFVVESFRSARFDSPVKQHKAVVEQDNEKCYSGKGNRLYRGTVVGVKTIHLYEIEYPDSTTDINIPFGALRVPQGMTESEIKVGTSVDVLSWQERFPEV